MTGVSGAANVSAYSASTAAGIGLTSSAAKDHLPELASTRSRRAFLGPGRM
jgi:hypothetical protein